MRRYPLVALALAGALSWAASSASAQDYRSSVGWNGGAMLTTSLNGGGGAEEGAVDLKPSVTWSLGGHYDQWIGGGRAGVRLAAGLARHTLPWVQGDRSVYSYRGDLGLMLRLAPPQAGRSVSPFLSGGVGFLYWGLGNGAVTSFAPAGAQYGGDEKVQLAAVPGIGFDILTPWRWGEGPVLVRLEVRDFIQLDSPFEPIDPEASSYGMVHNVFISLGFHTGIGTLVGGY